MVDASAGLVVEKGKTKINFGLRRKNQVLAMTPYSLVAFSQQAGPTTRLQGAKICLSLKRILEVLLQSVVNHSRDGKKYLLHFFSENRGCEWKSLVVVIDGIGKNGFCLIFGWQILSEICHWCWQIWMPKYEAIRTNWLKVATLIDASQTYPIFPSDFNSQAFTLS